MKPRFLEYISIYSDSFISTWFEYTCTHTSIILFYLKSTYEQDMKMYIYLYNIEDVHIPYEKRKREKVYITVLNWFLVTPISERNSSHTFSLVKFITTDHP